MIKLYLMPFLIAVVMLSGCSSMKIEDYAKNKPQFDLFDYFTGKTKGWGMVQDRNGNLKRQFVVDIVGTVQIDGRLVLDESFVWSDGEKSKRVWTITRVDKHTFTGKADDVDGEASGKAYGNALNWRYVLNLPVDNRTWKINFDDWMFLQPDGVLLNKAKMSKFGLKVGEVIISFKK